MIDIGGAATDRASVGLAGNTFIGLDNPANGSGTLRRIELWAEITMTGTYIGTFYGTAPTFTNRDYEYIGTITAGSKVTETVSISVESGDYIGVYFGDGKIEYDNAGGSGSYYKAGFVMPVGTQTYSLGHAGGIFSLFGASGFEYEDSCTDGITVGDTAHGGFPYSNEITDGLKIGDATAYEHIIPLILADGLKLSENLATWLQSYPTVTDGITVGEILATLLETFPALSDGTKLSDTLANYLTLYLSASDGLKLTDALIGKTLFYIAMTEGITLSDLAALYLAAKGRLHLLINHKSKMILDVDSKSKMNVKLRGGAEL